MEDDRNRPKPANRDLVGDSPIALDMPTNLQRANFGTNLSNIEVEQFQESLKGKSIEELKNMLQEESNRSGSQFTSEILREQIVEVEKAEREFNEQSEEGKCVQSLSQKSWQIIRDRIIHASKLEDIVSRHDYSKFRNGNRFAINGEVYTVEEKLGEGGQGSTYAVTDSKGEEFGIKFLMEKADEPDFEEERRLRYMEINEAIHTDYSITRLNDLFLVLKYKKVLGKNLAERQKINNRVSSERETIDITRELCAEYLKVLHERNLVHGDIKPENVIQTPDGRVKLIDFELLRKDGDGLSTVNPMNTMAFNDIMYKHQKITDYQALARLMYYLRTGKRRTDRDILTLGSPRTDEKMLEDMTASEELKNVMRKMLGYNDRYDSVDDLIRDLERLKIENKSPQSRTEERENEWVDVGPYRVRTSIEVIEREEEPEDEKQEGVNVGTEEIDITYERAIEAYYIPNTKDIDLRKFLEEYKNAAARYNPKNECSYRDSGIKNCYELLLYQVLRRMGYKQIADQETKEKKGFHFRRIREDGTIDDLFANNPVDFRYERTSRDGKKEELIKNGLSKLNFAITALGTSGSMGAAGGAGYSNSVSGALIGGAGCMVAGAYAAWLYAKTISALKGIPALEEAATEVPFIKPTAYMDEREFVEDVIEIKIIKTGDGKYSLSPSAYPHATGYPSIKTAEELFYKDFDIDEIRKSKSYRQYKRLQKRKADEQYEKAKFEEYRKAEDQLRFHALKEIKPQNPPSALDHAFMEVATYPREQKAPLNLSDTEIEKGKEKPGELPKWVEILFKIRSYIVSSKPHLF